MDKIELVPVEWLAHHPDNPRKDLGDLTELAESIRANGILQNLTIVASEDDNEGDGTYKRFWVVIGNRRFEAAQMAGLTEVPCVISEMDRKTQVATMLQENMQRADLTVYEQAEGFQMMMDLGFKPKEISEKTGFSEKTVKDRLKLTKLNKKKFSQAVNQGATIMDLVEVTKLESKADQNDVLECAGTENFRQRLQSRLRDQDFKKNKARLEPVVKEFMNEIPSNERYSSKWNRLWSDDFKMEGSEDELRKHIKKIMAKDPDVPWCYEISSYNTGGEIEFRKGNPKKVMSAEEKTERQKSIIRGKHIRLVKSFWAQAYDLRKDFVKNYTVANGQSASTLGKVLIKYALDSKPEWNGKLPETHKWSDKYVRDVLGLSENPVEKPDQDPNTPSYRHEYMTIWQQVDGKSDVPLVRVMLAWAVGGGVFWPDDPEHGLWHWEDGTYDKHSNRDDGVTRLYEFLMEIGYQLSDMEKQLLDGTHPCYQEDAGL